MDFVRNLTRRNGVARVWVPAAVVLSALLFGVATLVSRSESAGRNDLRERFALRTTLAGQFAESYTRELQARERIQARRWFSASGVSHRTFEQVAGSMGFDAAVLLDSRGRVLAVIPRKDTLLGTMITAKYPHLRAAVHGRAALSPIVLSAAQHEPIVASAIPYPTSSGRRVFSGGFRIAATPLGAYLRTTASIRGSAFALVDNTGRVVVGSDRAEAAGAAGVLRGTRNANGYYVTAVAVKGAPWRIAAAVPTNQLYAPLGHHRLFPWLIFAAFAAASMIALTLLYRLIRRNEQLDRLSTIDPLTGVWNRRALDAAYNRRLAHQARYGGREGALLLLDLDNFKQLNDLYGHSAGDKVLAVVAQTLQTQVRESDIVARLGGDEFSILLPQATRQGAQVVIEKLSTALDAITFTKPSFGNAEIHASIGLALEEDTAPSLDALLSAADDAMYRAKRTSTLSPRRIRQTTSKEPLQPAY